MLKTWGADRYLPGFRLVASAVTSSDVIGNGGKSHLAASFCHSYQRESRVALVLFAYWSVRSPKGPRTQIIGFSGPNTILSMVFGS